MDPLPHEGAGDDGRYRKKTGRSAGGPQKSPRKGQKTAADNGSAAEGKIYDTDSAASYRQNGRSPEAEGRIWAMLRRKDILRETAENVRDDNRIGERTGKRNRSCGNGTPEGKKIGRDTEYPQKKVGIT